MNIFHRSILSSLRYCQLNQRYAHYLSEANPVRQPKDLVTCILNNTIYHDEQIVVFNKPPGVMVLDETWDRKAEISNENEEDIGIDKSSSSNSNPCTIQYHMPQFRSALQWDHFFPCIRTPNEPSGLLIYTQNSKLHDDIKKTAMRLFRKSKQPYLTFYGITTSIPRKLEDSHHFMIERLMHNHQYLSYEVFDATSNALKEGRVYTGTVQHRTLSTNDELKVALVEFKSTTCTWDFVEIYCLRQCAPLLGDNKYWNRVKLVAGVPMYVNPIKHKIFPAKQQLSKHVRLALDLYGQQITCPLHLHLTDFDLSKKYRRQSAIVHYRASPFPYFFETLERLKLKFPDDLEMNKPFEQNRDQEFEDLSTMGQGMSEALPGVYVSSALVARQGKVLDEFGITHVISIQAKPISPFTHREYLLIPAKDHISQDLLQFIVQCNDFIHGARLNRGKVLIHCVEGKSRSPSIACVYLMTITSMPWSDVINSLRGVRTLVDPNFAFQRQLKHFYDKLMVQERERLFTKFGAFNMIDDDRNFVLKNLALYNAEQQRRLTGKLDNIDQSHLSRKNDVVISFSNNHDQSKPAEEIDPELEQFFQTSDLSPMTSESQNLLDEMFSS